MAYDHARKRPAIAAMSGSMLSSDDRNTLAKWARSTTATHFYSNTDDYLFNPARSGCSPSTNVDQMTSTRWNLAAQPPVR